jgi:hypothetical protein
LSTTAVPSPPGRMPFTHCAMLSGHCDWRQQAPALRLEQVANIGARVARRARERLVGVHREPLPARAAEARAGPRRSQVFSTTVGLIRGHGGLGFRVDLEVGPRAVVAVGVVDVDERELRRNRAPTFLAEATRPAPSALRGLRARALLIVLRSVQRRADGIGRS